MRRAGVPASLSQFEASTRRGDSKQRDLNNDSPPLRYAPLLKRAGVAEWQTRGTQNPVSFTGCVGSTPTFGTYLRRSQRLANVLRTPVYPGFFRFWRTPLRSGFRSGRILSRCQGFSPVITGLGQFWARGWASQRLSENWHCHNTS